MAVELSGNVRMREDSGPGVGVTVVLGNGRLRLVAGNELVGDWRLSEIGISALQDGFIIRAEGEEFVLRTEDDVMVAEEIGLVAASPRLARRLAARNNPEAPEPVETVQVSPTLAAIGFSIAGALVVLGGTFLRLAAGTGGEIAALSNTEESGFDFWLAFIVGGVLMIGAGYVMSLGGRRARALATLLLLVMIGAFGFAASESNVVASQLTAYGFVAGGLVVGVAVLVSGGLRHPD